MRIGIVSDTLGNYPAFSSVNKHMDSEGVDIKVHLGNIVGVCPWPNECVDLVLKDYNYVLTGKFDQATVDEDLIIGMPPLDEFTAKWTLENISEFAKSTIENMDSLHVFDKLMFVGATDGIESYSETENSALSMFSHYPFDIAFIGKTGVPTVWTSGVGDLLSFAKVRFSESQGVSSKELGLKEGTKYIINTGSVGISKDGDPRACYVIYDSEENTITHYKVPYAVDKVVGKMQQKSFPPNLYTRILYGR